MKKILLIIALFIFFSALAIYAAIQMRRQATTQEKGKISRADTVYQIVRDTVYIDRSAKQVSAWDQYEIKISDDSIYIYDAQELLGVLDSKEGGKIDSILRAENH